MSVKDLEGVNQRRSQYTSGLDRKDRWDATKDRESWVWKVGEYENYTHFSLTSVLPN